MEGVFTGMLDVYYAKMTTKDTGTSAPAYSTPAVLGKGIEVTITPQIAEGSLDASNRRIKWKRKITGYEISMNTDNIDPAAMADVTGRQSSTAGVQFVSADDIAPDVALGFCATYDDGTKEYWWVYKCNCEEVTRTMHTEESDNIEFQTPTLTAVARPRLDNGRLAAIADSNTVETTAILTGWFSNVFLADPT